MKNSEVKDTFVLSSKDHLQELRRNFSSFVWTRAAIKELPSTKLTEKMLAKLMEDEFTTYLKASNSSDARKLEEFVGFIDDRIEFFCLKHDCEISKEITTQLINSKSNEKSSAASVDPDVSHSSLVAETTLQGSTIIALESVDYVNRLDHIMSVRTAHDLIPEKITFILPERDLHAIGVGLDVDSNVTMKKITYVSIDSLPKPLDEVVNRYFYHKHRNYKLELVHATSPRQTLFRDSIIALLHDLDSGIFPGFEGEETE
jgi:hypothetical protein